MKHIVSRTYRPMLVKYLSRTRRYHYKQTSLEIPPEVFHPGFFSSTLFLLKHLDRIELSGKRVLELGAGSGLISIQAAKKKAIVTASDINPVAIETLRKNAANNRVKIDIIESDLFEHIRAKQFDVIAINPPYYKKDPATMAEYAWYCGENADYFFRLFAQLGQYIHRDAVVAMVLCDGCDIPLIEKAAAEHGFIMAIAQQKQYLLEKNFIYRITQKENETTHKE